MGSGHLGEIAANLPEEEGSTGKKAYALFQQGASGGRRLRNICNYSGGGGLFGLVSRKTAGGQQKGRRSVSDRQEQRYNTTFATSGE